METSKALRFAAQRRLKALDDLEAARVDLAEAIRADAASGVRQVDIVKATGYTREMIRRIVATHSAEPITDAHSSDSPA